MRRAVVYEEMKALRTCTILLAATLGCNKINPPPVPVVPKYPADNPSILVDPPYPGKSQAGAKPDFPGALSVGNSKSDLNRPAGIYQSWADYTLQRGDKAEIDPRWVAARLRRWIESAPGVTILAAPDDAVVDGQIRGTIEYQTAGTSGKAVYFIEATSPAAKVRYRADVSERRR